MGLRHHSARRGASEMRTYAKMVPRDNKGAHKAATPHKSLTGSGQWTEEAQKDAAQWH